MIEVWTLAIVLVIVILIKRWMPKRPPLLILDMNNVLVYRVFIPKQLDEKPETIPYNDQGTVLGGKFYTWKRPHLDQFIDRCFEKYTVAVWSSAQTVNVSDLVDFVFGTRRKKLLFFWGQSMCDTWQLPGIHKPLFKKQLHKVWSTFPEYTARNTFIMDDSADKISDNPPNTCLLVKPWVVMDEGDDELLKLF